MRGTVLFGAAALMVAAGSAFGQTTVAQQDFNGLSDANTFNADVNPIGTIGAPLSNSGAQNSPSGYQLGFGTTWTDSNGNAGPLDGAESGDFIGVNSFAGNNSPDVGPTGAPVASGSEHNFEFNDADGQLDLTFAAVDMGVFNTNVSVSFNYWFMDTGYETPGDFFSATIGDGVNSISLANWIDVDIEARVSADDGSNNWGLITLGSLETSGLDVSNLNLAVSVSQNSGTENMFIDEVKFQGVPTPGAAALLGLGGLVATRRRRA